MKRDPGLVILLQLDEGLADGQQLVVEDLLQLAFREAFPVEDDAGGFETRRNSCTMISRSWMISGRCCARWHSNGGVCIHAAHSQRAGG
jgi:hypothetical protein